MIYQFICRKTGVLIERQMSVTEFDRTRFNVHCNCGAQTNLRITGGRAAFLRSPFPKGYSEHISEDGHYVRDVVEAREVAAENGFTSAVAENWR